MKTYRRIWFIVPPRFPAISSPVTIESCRKALVGALEESPILPAGKVLSGPETGLPGLTCRAFAQGLANGPTPAYKAIKRVLHAWRSGGVAEADRVSIAEAPAVMLSEDFKNGGRKPAAVRLGPRHLSRPIGVA